MVLMISDLEESNLSQTKGIAWFRRHLIDSRKDRSLKTPLCANDGIAPNSTMRAALSLLLNLNGPSHRSSAKSKEQENISV